jgi:hypothetical protein
MTPDVAGSRRAAQARPQYRDGGRLAALWRHRSAHPQPEAARRALRAAQKTKEQRAAQGSVRLEAYFGFQRIALPPRVLKLPAMTIEPVNSPLIVMRPFGPSRATVPLRLAALRLRNDQDRGDARAGFGNRAYGTGRQGMATAARIAGGRDGSTASAYAVASSLTRSSAPLNTRSADALNASVAAAGTLASWQLSLTSSRTTAPSPPAPPPWP